MMKGNRKFRMNAVLELRRLFKTKDKANKNEQKIIRGKMRSLGFYISDFAKDMNSTDFEILVNKGEIEIVDFDEFMAKNTKSSLHENVTSQNESKEKVNVTHLCENSSKESNENLYKEGLAPWIDENSEILILGSLPSDVSIRKQAYYQNKSKNSFWKIMHGLFGNGDDTKEFLLDHHIALWDCLASANREGSLDSGFCGEEHPNKIEELLTDYPNIKKIVLNGKSGAKVYFDRFFVGLYNRKNVVVVPSSSNANAMKFDDKLNEWRLILK